MDHPPISHRKLSWEKISHLYSPHSRLFWNIAMNYGLCLRSSGAMASSISNGTLPKMAPITRNTASVSNVQHISGQKRMMEDSQSSQNLAIRQKIVKKSALSQKYQAHSGSAKRSKSRSSTLSETKAKSSGLSAVTLPKGEIQPESSASATKTCVLQEAKRRTTEVTITFTDDVPYESDDDDDLSDIDDNWVEIPKECYSDFTTYVAFLRSLKK